MIIYNMIDILFYRIAFEEKKKKMKNTIPDPTLVAFTTKWGQTTIEFEK